MGTNNLTNFFVEHSESMTTWVVAALFLLVGIALLWPALRRGYQERSLRRRIRSAAADALHKVVIPDGMEGAVYLENLLLTPDGLLILPVHRYQGVVFAAEGIDNWTQVIGKRTYKFPNPLPQLESEVLALRDYAGKVPVDSRVIFTKGVEFPKGRPEKLISTAELEALAKQNRQRDIPTAYQQAWESLKRQIKTPEVSRLRELYSVEREPAMGGGGRVGLLMLILAAAWLAWRIWPG